ncbi:chalcone isomerase family protein [Azonexus sp. IMCC34839]|uniref:chalcone isomerase family protein n=1 Tax=Azonexus sp. IMCC34839 TaxID=3133695 RepID=UPI00399A8930
MITSNTVRQAALIATLVAAPGLHAAEVAGVKLDDKIRVGGSELVLNGAGVRSKLFIKVYVGALYVGQKSTAPAAIYDSTGPRRMALRMLRDVDAESLHSALDDGLKANHTPEELAGIKAASDQLASIMKGIGKAREGDTIAIDFLAEGVAVSLNGESRGKVAAPALAKALLKVWLGDKPADAALKKSLLGS